MQSVSIRKYSSDSTDHKSSEQIMICDLTRGVRIAEQTVMKGPDTSTQEEWVLYMSPAQTVPNQY